MKKEITYEIIQNLGVLSEVKSGWKKEVNLMSWNGKDPVIDIRDWSPDKEKMGKGITLTMDEKEILLTLLENLNIETEVDSNTSEG